MSREKELEIVNNATPGPWEAFGNTIAADAGRCTCSGVEPWPGHEPYCGSEEMAQASEADALFIATFNPARVRELLDRVERLEDDFNTARLLVENLLARLETVENLHYPVELEPSDTICGRCSANTGQFFAKIVEWPCDDIKAARGE